MTKHVLPILLAGGCALAPMGDEFGNQVRGLPTCSEMPAGVPREWPDQDVSDTFSLSLPSCFVREHVDGSPPYMHGGVRWRCEVAVVEVIWGIWGRGSFPELPKCLSKVGDQRVMVGRGTNGSGRQLVVWYPTGHPYEPLVSVSSSRAEDGPILENVAFSGRVKSRK